MVQWAWNKASNFDMSKVRAIISVHECNLDVIFSASGGELPT